MGTFIFFGGSDIDCELGSCTPEQANELIAQYRAQ
jgi:hypothetical protein